MKRLWVRWSRRRFVWSLLPAAAVLIAVRTVLLRATESQKVEIAIQGASILISTFGLYVVFTWAAEYDRRNPRDYK